MKVQNSFIFDTSTVLLMSVLLLLMMVSVYAGVRVRRRRQALPGGKNDGRGAIMSAMLALFGFLLAFTFGMSGSRFDARRNIIVEEANAIGTAVLRADMYPDSLRAALRIDFQRYVEARIAFYEKGKDIDGVRAALAEGAATGKSIWDRVAALSHNRDLFVASAQMIPAVNNMLDLSTARTIGELSRVPDTVVYMLFMLAIVSAFFVGYTLADSIDWLSAGAFCFLTVLIIFIILDLDRPRRGFIDLSTSHQAMIELRKMF